MRTPLNQADYAQLPLLNKERVVSSWREKLPPITAEEQQYDRRPVSLGKQGPGVYVIEAVNGDLHAYGVAVVSEDHGRTWQRGELAPGISGDECQLVELSDGRWLFDIRQQRGPHRWRATSSDGGKTWSTPRAGERVSAVACAIERYTLKAAGEDRDRLLWTGPKGPQRSNLVIRVSYDEGATFALERAIAAGPAAYSDLTILKDKTAGALWERGTNNDYQFISFTRA